jgi:NADPH2:quinone reductase
MSGYASGGAMPLTAGDLFRTGVAVSAAAGPWMTSRPGAIRAYAEEALAELAAGRITPLVHPPFHLAEAGDAHHSVETRAGPPPARSASCPEPNW